VLTNTDAEVLDDEVVIIRPSSAAGERKYSSHTAGFISPVYLVMLVVKGYQVGYASDKQNFHRINQEKCCYRSWNYH
jgi:hypothetical protein